MRLSLWSLAALALVALAGTAVACEGLSPGDVMTTDAGLCTLSFLVADPNGLYFATAGHCIQVDQKASNPDHGEIGVGVYHYLEPENGDSSDGSPGMDFGLIRINTDLYPDLNPKVCGWEGPVGMYDGSGEGGAVRHYGHGVVYQPAGPNKREGLFLTTDDIAFYFTGTAVPGDSGSAVLDESNLAVGVYTHVLVGLNGIPPANEGGTLLARGFELAAEAGFPRLRLVLAGEDPVAVLAALRNAPPPGSGEAAGGAPAGPSASPSASPNTTSPPPSSSNGAGRNETAGPQDDSTLAPAATTDDAGAQETPGAEGKRTPALAPAFVLALALGLALARRKA